MLEAGIPAPEFEGVDQHGETFRLMLLRGRWVVLYFYPRDETPGCTMEACAFRDSLESFGGIQAEVVGISTQDQASHRRFAENHELNFRLIADPDGNICRAYDALGFLGVAKRVTYLIDPSGVIRDVYRSEARPASHADHMKARLRELQATALRH